MTPVSLFVEIIILVLLHVEEAKEIAEETLLLMRKDISRHAIIVSREGKKVKHFISIF